MKGCGEPSKGNVGAHKHTYSLCLIVPLSLSAAEGAALKPEHRKCDRKRTAGPMFQVYIPAVLHIVGLPYFGIFELYQTAPQRRSELIQMEVLSN